ncbi:OB-fold domain-containing protein [Caballeronia sp. LZ065]|uniref:Zn-ribbon domain-containing OB-fold protein n=1 Tax=Caballeronia sp. LZ065 TaxID=3038571 RepID=UPI00285EDF20|nr:OB-fold domain-containing protein [Caballeronia sp. LZ065]MDR5784730.1 OB-fold domain-containing protein [Caballeronia sp. LZ065]
MNHELGPEAQFFAYLKQGKFMLQRHRTSHDHVFYPRALHARGTMDDFEWVEASGDGVIYSCTHMRRPAERGGDYTIALIDLAEGPRILSRLVDVEPERVSIAMPVRATILVRSWSSTEPDCPVVAFTPLTPLTPSLGDRS